ncbi:hypothetical protein D3C79_1011330 [compost metagenome]
MPHHPLQVTAQLCQLDTRAGIALHGQRRVIGAAADLGDATVDFLGYRTLLFSRRSDLLIHLLDQ